MLFRSKKPKALQPDNSVFNTVVALARVVNENCIGLLKNRWAFLKGISTQVIVKEDFVLVYKQCMTCVMLHNFALAYHDLDPFDDASDEEEDEQDDGNVELMSRTETHEGDALRESVKAAMLDGM
ncbi:hypothetical protein PR001_g22056 [Phytophthora rubi]|uniref:DDE Tnp4 domain-containing protein n=1 Tax=Phytophthora rubi TaxID=129364 RepID=A0A6A3J1Q6_9STRA|nr:hypothetical protein PR001_g22056 [Phytophthora rubi]KAE9001557.1 hypothetical protein PR002_g17883 [Phytophthora rubi]